MSLCYILKRKYEEILWENFICSQFELFRNNLDTIRIMLRVVARLVPFLATHISKFIRFAELHFYKFM
jgi:hypothetical protein